MFFRVLIRIVRWLVFCSLIRILASPKLLTLDKSKEKQVFFLLCARLFVTLHP